MTAAWRFYFLMPVRAWKATTPDLNGTGRKSPETATLTVSPGPAPPLQSHNPACRHAAAARPHGGGSGRRAPARGNGGPPSGRGAVPRVSTHAAGYGDTTPYDQRPAELQQSTDNTSYIHVDMGIGPPCWLRNCIGLGLPICILLGDRLQIILTITN